MQTLLGQVLAKKPLLYKQKLAVRIIFNEGRLSHSKPLLKCLKFNDIVKKPEHKYPTTFLSLNYTLRKYSFTNSRFLISFRGPKLWNEILNKEEKGLESYTLFKKASN